MESARFLKKGDTKILIIWKNLTKYSAVELSMALLSKLHLYLVPLRREQLLWNQKRASVLRWRPVSVCQEVSVWKAPLTSENRLSLITMGFSGATDFTGDFTKSKICLDLLLLSCVFCVYSNLCNLLLGYHRRRYGSSC